MTIRNILALDQGTTNTKAILVTEAGEIVARASSPLATHYPHPGWAEQSATDIWASVKAVIAEVVAKSDGTRIDAIGIANQRETLVTWNARTSRPICPAIIWQCRRTADACAALVAAGHDDAVVAATGLSINPLFPASKLAWILENVPGARELSDQGHLRAGTVDAWLLWNLTGGSAFATDHSNASRTQLFDTAALQFSPELCGLFGVPVACLPVPMASDAAFGATAGQATALPAGVPIRAMMGDSHAALYGHGVRAPGTVKATFGTGSSLMTLTSGRTVSRNGLSGTIAWTSAAGTAYALEGNITVSAQAAAFMAKILRAESVQALSDTAQTVPDAGGAVFVPALAGLGAPHWDDRATGTITGMTHGTTPAHLARAAFDAIAHQIADVFEAMERDMNHKIAGLRADGGASSNEFLMQIQADLLGRPVQRSDVEEVGALGVASMALGAQFRPQEVTEFVPVLPAVAREQQRDKWVRALIKTRA
jgi:glycerol kinase